MKRMFFLSVRLKWRLLALCGFLTALSVHAQTTMVAADGTTDTYALIEKILGKSTASETPDCAHPEFGPHITQTLDDTLGKYVFSFFIHVKPDNDRCLANIRDRQRNEIKTVGSSPEPVKGLYGDTCTYHWFFKLDSEFQPSTSFTHIHQIKAGDGGDEGMPLITITPRAGKPEKLQIMYASPKEFGGKQTAMASAPLSGFKGQWIEATERILYATNGTYELTLKQVSDGAVLLSCSTNVNMWRGNATYIRPKWGIYRSINSASALRDEEVRFADFCITKEANSCPGDAAPAVE